MKKALLFALILLVPGVSAYGDASCEKQCPEGQVLITFADGNNLSCTCVDAGSGMVEGPSGCEGSNCDAPNEVNQQG
mgnify:CR=1 FL=1